MPRCRRLTAAQDTSNIRSNGLEKMRGLWEFSFGTHLTWQGNRMMWKWNRTSGLRFDFIITTHPVILLSEKSHDTWISAISLFFFSNGRITLSFAIGINRSWRSNVHRTWTNRCELCERERNDTHAIAWHELERSTVTWVCGKVHFEMMSTSCLHRKSTSRWELNVWWLEAIMRMPINDWFA